MNIEWCRNKCGISCQPRKLIRTRDGRMLLEMQNLHGIPLEDAPGKVRCPEYLEVEAPAGMLKRVPKGWFRTFEQEGDAIGYCGDGSGLGLEACWKIRILPTSGCPYAMEHELSDIHHDGRLKEWRQKEKKRIELKLKRGNDNGV